MQFTYQARDMTGRVCDGQLVADTATEATRQLRQEGMYLLSLDEGPPATVRTEFSLFQKRVSQTEVIYLTDQLAIMIDAGVPMAVALDGIGRQTENPTLNKILASVQKSVEGGDDLSVALSRFPKQFDSTYVNLIRASEASGTMGVMLERIATQMRTEFDTKQKIRGALAYPAAMVMLCVGVSIFLLTYVFPKLMPMFTSRSIDLPLPTKLMIVLSNALTAHWYWFVVVTVVLVGLFRYASKQTWGRKAFDWVWLNAPVVGPMLRKVIIGRTLRTLATTVNAGVPVLEAIQLSARVANNVHYEKSWMDVSEQVSAGRQIHEALEGNPLFPHTLLQMISSGESTGKLGFVLNKVSDYFEKEVANAVKAATSLIEPAMVLIMGGVIGTIALAMLLPIFKLSTHAG